MNPRKRDDVSAALAKRSCQSNNDHMKFTYFCSIGKKTQVWTKISRGSGHKDITVSIQANGKTM